MIRANCNGQSGDYLNTVECERSFVPGLTEVLSRKWSATYRSDKISGQKMSVKIFGGLILRQSPTIIIGPR